MNLVFIAAFVPTVIVGFCLYYVIFNLTAAQIGIPEAIAYNLFPVAKKVNIIILTILPFSITIIAAWAYVISHRVAGPLNRIYSELDDRINNKKHGHIYLRKNDELVELVERINKLIDKTSKG